MPEKYTKKDLKGMSFPEKQKLAKEMGFSIYGKTEEELIALITGKTTTGGIRYPRAEIFGLTKEELEAKKEEKVQIPKDTFIPGDKRDEWMKIIAKKPFAFNDVDLTDREAEIIHILEDERKGVECACGAKFDIPERDLKGNPIKTALCPGVEETRRDLDGHPRKRQKCIDENNFRKYIVHEVPK